MEDDNLFDDIDEDLLEAKLSEIAPYIGRLVIAFTSLEELVNLLLVDTLNEHDPDMGWIVIANMTYSDKVELLGKLNNRMYILCDKTVLASKLDVILQDLKEAGKKRNEAVHAAWYDWNIKSTKVKTKIKVKKDGPEKVFIKITSEEVQSTIDFIENLEVKLDTFWEEVGESLFS